MRVAILYFSGTGVTAEFAKEIAKGFEKAEHKVELVRLKKGKQFDFSTYDIIGIGAPAYAFRAPRLTTRLLRKIDFKKKPFFVFCTSGGMSGNALWNLYIAVKKTTGYCLGFTEGFGTTNLRSWMPLLESKEKLWGLNDYDYTRAQNLAAKVLNRLESLVSNPPKRKIRNWSPKMSISTLLWSALFTWRWMMAATVGLKRVNKDKCTQCGLCATQICPSGAITMTIDDYPKFNEFTCVGCNGCVNLCPEDAIWSIITRKHKQYDLYKTNILKE
ncbi:MAG: EFR1 family ferrodoxin [Candidatus Heimdallarchaeota archaeon]